MDFRPLHCLHHQLTPSDTSFLALSSICTLHLCIMYGIMHTQMYYVCIHKCILGNDHQTYDLILLISWYLEQVCVLASNLFTCKKVITPSIGPNIIGPYSIKESEDISSNVVTMNQNPCLLSSPPKVTLLPAKSFAQPAKSDLTSRQKRLKEFIKDCRIGQLQVR